MTSTQEKDSILESINAVIRTKNDRQKAYIYVDLIQHLAMQAEKLFCEESERIMDDDSPNLLSFADVRESVTTCREINRIVLLKTHPYTIR